MIVPLYIYISMITVFFEFVHFEVWHLLHSLNEIYKIMSFLSIQFSISLPEIA